MSEAEGRLREALADRYRIERQLGQGGMATVYLAEDLKHHRQVAIKVLRPELAAVLGAERFVVEIQTTAQLQHPHILPLFDSGQAGGFLYYVMPYIEGETLRDKLNRETQLGIEESVRITREVADALDYAHRHGVIHRDIKPENILLHDGRPMVADFGIALAVSAAAGGRMTETGLSLGTPHYMSPEQATADKDLTNRSDIYSLGSVLYEMLTGNPPHVGASAQQIIMKIVTEEAAPVTKQRKSVPPNVAAAISKAIEKLPADRFESAKAFADALANPGFTSATMTTAAVAGRPRSRWPVIAAALLGAGAVLAVSALLARARSNTLPVLRLSLNLPPAQGIAFVRTRRFDLSPDGSRLVYVGPDTIGTQLWIRDLNSLTSRPLSGTSTPLAPFFSPDGRSVAFFSSLQQVRGDLRVVQVSGGTPVTLVRDSALPWGGSWDAAGNIYFTRANGAVGRVPATGGPVTSVTGPDSAGGTLELDYVQVLPGEKFALAVRWVGSNASSRIVALNLRTGQTTTIVEGNQFRYAAGQLVYTTNDGVFLAAPFDPGRSAITGPPRTITEEIQFDQFSGTGQFGLAENGLLVYLAGTSAGTQELVWVDRAGRVTSVDSAWHGPFETLALSPDGTRLAVSVVGEDGKQIWIKRLPSGPRSRLTHAGVANWRPTWTRDGQHVVFIADRDSAGRSRPYIQGSDGSTEARLLFTAPVSIEQLEFLPDGRRYVYRSGSSGQARLQLRLGTLGDTGSTVLATGLQDALAPAVSPDGRWVAYRTREMGQDEVFVRSLEDLESPRIQVSSDGGGPPRWAHSGRELFYRTREGDMMAVTVTVQGRELRPGTPRPLFRMVEAVPEILHHFFAVSLDDQRFLMVREKVVTATELQLVTNWLQTLEATAP